MSNGAMTQKRLAQELMLRAGHSIDVAITISRQFEREWCPEQARLDAQDSELDAWLKSAQNAGGHKSPQGWRDWGRDLRRSVREAGERAYAQALDK